MSPTSKLSKEDILFICGREIAYPRNSLLFSALHNQFNASAISSTSKHFLLRYLSLYLQFIKFSKNRLRLTVVGFLGQPLAPFIRFFWKGPILFDAFISVYDTICFDRKWASPTSIFGKLAFYLDKLSCFCADHIILDTYSHAKYFHDTFNIPMDKLSVLYVGCDENIFYPRESSSKGSTQAKILFYGSFLPVHGIDIILRAAKLLEADPLQFQIIGDGIEKKNLLRLAKDLNVKNITFCPSVPLEQLPMEIASATICLGGHFGSSEKAKKVIAGKTFQCLAMGIPTIVGENEANHELLTHGVDAWFCEMNNPAALANAIQYLISNPEIQKTLGENARNTFMQKASTKVLSKQIIEMVNHRF